MLKKKVGGWVLYTEEDVRRSLLCHTDKKIRRYYKVFRRGIQFVMSAKSTKKRVKINAVLRSKFYGDISYQEMYRKLRKYDLSRHVS